MVLTYDFRASTRESISLVFQDLGNLPDTSVLANKERPMVKVRIESLSKNQVLIPKKMLEELIHLA